MKLRVLIRLLFFFVFFCLLPAPSAHSSQNYSCFDRVRYGTPPSAWTTAATLQSAYDLAGDNQRIETVGMVFIEDLLFDRNKTVTLIGGYSCDYLAPAGTGIINGAVTISLGTVVLDGIELSGCPRGFGTCGPASGCQTNVQDDADNCGGCGLTCSVMNGTGVCLNGTCTTGACHAGFGDCDGYASNGCETDTRISPNHCGTCPNNCTLLPHVAAAICTTGGCAIAACSPLWANADNVTSNGCELHAPAAPTDLLATPVSTEELALTWTSHSDNETGFRIERGTDGLVFSQVGTVGAGVSVFADSGLALSTRYYYRVFAYNSAGDSAASNTAAAKPAACSVTAGTGSALLLHAALVLPGGLQAAGDLLIDQGVIVCAGGDCSTAPGAAAATVLRCPHTVISPGLINASSYAPYGQNAPSVDTGERYEQRNEWRLGLNGHTQLSAGGTGDPAWEEVRQIMAGTTSGITRGFVPGLMRNLDSPAGLEGLSHASAEAYSFPLGDQGGVTPPLPGCGYPSILTWESIQANAASLITVGEGVNAAAENEFPCLAGLAPSSQNLLRNPSVIVGGVGLTLGDINLAASRGTGLVWTPRSDTRLYGATAPVPVYRRAGARIGLGTYWSVTGSANMLRELACAGQWNTAWHGTVFTDRELVDMATHNGAILTGFGELLGELAPGKAADIVIWDALVHKDYRAILDAGNPDIVLVFRGGTVLYGDEDLVSALTLPGDCESLDVCGRSKQLCALRETGRSYSDLLSSAAGAYPLYACGSWPSEPTCRPSRPALVNGATPYTGIPAAGDKDGDGISDATDNCPDLFNPLLPLYGSVQADTNGNGNGDVCDASDSTIAAPQLVSLLPAAAFAREGQTGATVPDPLTVALAAAPDSDIFVSVISLDPALVIPGGGVIVQAGTTSSVVPVAGTAQSAGVVVTASLNGREFSSTVRIIGAAETPRLVSLSPASGVITINKTRTYTVGVDFPSSSGCELLLSADAGSLPASVTIPQDQLTASFIYTAGTVAATATISAQLGTDTPLLATAHIVEPRPLDGTHLVLNEIDYDQPGTDYTEFVEIYNPTPDSVSLANLALVFINGSNNAEYLRVPLAGASALEPGGYLVVASPTVAVDPGAKVIRFSKPADNIQNGAPDGIALIDTLGPGIVDALSYEGSITQAQIIGIPGTVSLVEGTLLPLAREDNNAINGSLIRYPNGTDTDNAANDWWFSSTPTPGAQNIP